MEAFDPIVIKVKGDAGDVIAMLAALKKAMREFSDESHKTNDKVRDDFGGSEKSVDHFTRLVKANMREGQTALESLRLKSTDLRGEIAKLRAEFARTGDKATFGKLSQAESDFKKITSYVRSMEGDAKKLAPDMGRLAREGGQSLSIFEELAGTMSGFGPAIALGVAALAPLLGGMVGGTVLSVLAGGGLAAGIITQFGSSEVQSAIQQFADRVSTTWMDATRQFAPETGAAISALTDDLVPVIGEIGKAIDHLAPFVSGIADAFGKGAQILGGDLAADLGKMSPIFTSLERSIPIVAQGIGEFFNDLADHAPEIANDIETIAHGFETLMNVAGHTVGFLSSLMAGVHTEYQLFTGDLTGFVETVHDAMGSDEAITRFGNINQVEKTLGDTTDSLAGSYAHLAAEMKNAFDEAMALDGSEVSMYQSMNDLRDALKQNKGAWDITTRAGEAHRLALLQAIQATETYYTNLGKVNGISPALATAYKNQIDSLLALASQAGLSKDQVALLKTQFDNLIKVMDKAGPVTIPVNVVYHVQNRPSIGVLSGSKYYAQSGVHSFSAREPEHYDRSGVYAGRPGGYYMGEASTGDEAVIGRASNPGRAMAALVTAASWRGMAVTPSRGGAFTGPQAGYGDAGGGGMAMADVYLDVDKVGYAMVRWSGRFEGRSGVTIAGATTSTTIGQAR